MDTSDATVLGAGNVESMVNRSLEHRELNYTVSDEYRTTFALFRIISGVVYSLGVPGNLLSAVVWMRLYVATKNPSTLYLAALAINDLVWLLSDALLPYIDHCYGSVYWLCQAVHCLVFAGEAYDPLLVLSFSVARLIAIFRPLQVRGGQRAEMVEVSVIAGVSLSWVTFLLGGSVAEWLACWTQVQKGPGSNRSRDAVG